MDTFVVLLVLLSALLHATWNAFLHLSEDRVWLLGMMAIPYIAVSALGVIVLPLPAPAAWPYIFASVVLEFGCFVYCDFEYFDLQYRLRKEPRHEHLDPPYAAPVSARG